MYGWLHELPITPRRGILRCSKSLLGDYADKFQTPMNMAVHCRYIGLHPSLNPFLTGNVFFFFFAVLGFMHNYHIAKTPFSR